MRLVFISFLFLFSGQLLAKEKTYITFEKKNGKGSFELKTPLKCRVHRKDSKKRTGRIMKVVDDYVYFEYKDYDSTDVNKIMAMDLNRKQKFDLIDTMISESKTTEIIHQSKLTMISVLSRDDRLSTKLLMLGGAAGFMGSAVSFLISTSNKVGMGLNGWNLVQIAGMGGSVGLVGGLAKHNIDMSKWKMIAGRKK